MNRKYRFFAADFETTVYEGQERTDVWAAGLCELYTEACEIYHSIVEFWEALKKLKGNLMVYFHNLKFDGSFLVDYFLTEVKLNQAFIIESLTPYKVKFLSNKDMENNSFKYSISNMGKWYTLTIKINNRIIEFRDSVKLIPFSLAEVGESFQTKHRKLDMEYDGLRFPGCEITKAEKEYLKNDVYVLKEALEFMFDSGHNKMTIGSCCMAEFKKYFDKEDYKQFFPNLYEEDLDKEEYGSETIGDYIRKSYRGAWCYLVKGKEGKIFKKGLTADVNSLYPGMMHSDSGNYYPVGEPTFWTGDFIPEQALKHNRYYFIRFQCTFELKPGKLPFIQIKSDPRYKPNEMLETSDIYWRGKYHKEIINLKGEKLKNLVTISCTCTDFELIKEHYYLENFKILDGCWFFTEIGLFDQYIDKYKKIKMTSTGAMRTLAKLFSNNLYGKFASSTDSSFKLFEESEDGLQLRIINEKDKTPGYIPVGAAITSYARNFTIRHAQMNYYGSDRPGFIYADTDSIHCDIAEEDLKGIEIHDSEYGKWKIEKRWDKGLFIRQKTYLEAEGDKISITCAGMPTNCKNYFAASITGITNEETKEMFGKQKDNIQKWIINPRGICDFAVGLEIPGKLLPKRIPGGILLTETTYKIR